MILCVDIGNTATKVAAVVDGDVVARCERRTSTSPAALTAEFADLESAAGEAPEAIGISSVVPGGGATIVTGSVPVVNVSAATPLPIRLDVDAPETLGADRICAAAGAVDVSNRDAIVVDVGSAVTVDRVRDLAFTGGAIMPGPQMMLSALSGYTGQLPRLDLDQLPTLFPERPHPTPAAMAFGVGVAVTGGIREAVSRLQKRGERVPVWLTGGGARLVERELPSEWIRDPDLTFRGLYRITRHALGH